jgi:hypothetical protein
MRALDGLASAWPVEDEDADYSGHREGTSDVYDGVAVGHGMVFNDAVAAEGTGGVAGEGSSGVQAGACLVNVDAVGAGFAQEKTCGPSDGNAPESSGYKRR